MILFDVHVNINKMKNPDSKWFVWGISPKKKFRDCSYVERTFWGISLDGFWFLNGESMDGSHPHGNGFDTSHFNRTECCIDICLDVDAGILKFCVVGEADDGKEAVIEGVFIEDSDAVGVGHGWVPHFNFGSRAFKTQIRLAKIADTFYGKQLDIPW